MGTRMLALVLVLVMEVALSAPPQPPQQHPQPQQQHPQPPQQQQQQPAVPCATLQPPFCDCHPRNCSCASCGSCNDCKTCQICTSPPPPRPPRPPAVPPPQDWLPAIQAASMLYSGQADLGAWVESEHRKLPLYPNLGNGYLGGMLGCFAEDDGGEGPTAVPGVIHVAGVFTGKGTSSHRAETPGVFSLYPVSAAGSPVAFAGSSLDLATGVFTNRTKLPGCGAEVVLEQRWYAHRALRNALVYEVALLPSRADGLEPAASCSVTFSGCNGHPTDTVTTIVANTSDGVIHALSKTTAAETPSTSLVTVGRVYKQPPPTMALKPAATEVFLAVLTTSLAEEGGEVASDPLVAAARLYLRHRANGTATNSLKQSHEAAWSELYASRIELGGAADDPTATAVAAAVNSSMYYLLSAAREDWPFSTSPGGLANNAYLLFLCMRTN